MVSTGTVPGPMGAKDPLWNTRAAAASRLARLLAPLIDPPQITRSGESLGLPDDKILSRRLNYFFGH